MTTVFSLTDAKPRRERGVDAREDVGVPRAPGELAHPLGPQRVEADRHPPQPGPRELAPRGGASRMPLVVSARSRDARRSARAARTSVGQVVPQQRLAAGEPHLLARRDR